GQGHVGAPPELPAARFVVPPRRPPPQGAEPQTHPAPLPLPAIAPGRPDPLRVAPRCTAGVHAPAAPCAPARHASTSPGGTVTTRTAATLFTDPAPAQRLERAAAALTAHGFTVEILDDAAAARTRVKDLIPEGASV